MSKRFFVAPDGVDEPCLWAPGGANPALVLRKAELPGPYDELLWRVLTGVLAPDEATVTRVAVVLHKHQIESTGPGEVSCRGCRPKGWMGLGTYNTHVARAVLAALADPEGGESWKSR